LWTKESNKIEEASKTTGFKEKSAKKSTCEYSNLKQIIVDLLRALYSYLSGTITPAAPLSYKGNRTCGLFFIQIGRTKNSLNKELLHHCRFPQQQQRAHLFYQYNQQQQQPPLADLLLNFFMGPIALNTWY
jgi:hypothetical protein